jgi:hypothetical protein
MLLDLGKIDLRKTATDAGYVTVGLGVLGFQQAQVRRRELRQTVGEKTHGLRDRIETGARSANDWAQELGTQVKDRIEPVVGQVVDQVGVRVHTLINRAA